MVAGRETVLQVPIERVPAHSHTRPSLPITPAGGADSEALRGELVALDRAVQGVVLERTLQVGGCEGCGGCRG
jgi:hypothetical protein